jgi:hypothetical protein
MKRSLKNGVVWVSLAALVCGSGFLIHSRSQAGLASSASASAAPSTFAWTRGTRYLYDFRWTVRSTSQIDMSGATGEGATSANAASDLSGQLAFKSYGKEGENWLLGVSVPTLREAKLTAMGNDLFEGEGVARETFDGREALVEVGPRGEIVRLHFRATDPPLFKQLLQSVVGESQVVLPVTGGAREWRASEILSVGKLEMAYAVDDADPLHLHRTPVHMLAPAALPRGAARGVTAVLGGTSNVLLDRDGFVRSIASHLEVTIAGALEHRSDFAMTFISASEVEIAAHAPLDPAMQSVLPGAAPEAPDLRRRMDERFSARTSAEEITRMIGAYSRGLPPARGMITATAAFLRLHPEACEGIATQFLDPEVTPKSREFMMGLLASAGSPAAQSAMRRALDVPETRSDLGAYGRMIQRIGFVAQPNRESLEYLVALYDSPAISGDTDLRRVTGLTLGAALRKATGANKALAESIHGRLVAGLTAAQDTDAKIGLVAAVGNAARASDLPVLVKVAKDGEPRVRESVARALRGLDSPETRTTLREMLTDPSGDVSRAAARSYDAQQLSTADMTALATLVESGAVNAGADSALVAIVQGRMDQKEASEQILESVLSRHPNGEGSGQIRLLLRRLRGES